MKLIDILVQELPGQGGWPDGVDCIEMFANGSIFFGNHRSESITLSQCSDGWDYDMPDTYSNGVTQGQYETALAEKKTPAPQEKLGASRMSILETIRHADTKISLDDAMELVDSLVNDFDITHK